MKEIQFKKLPEHLKIHAIAKAVKVGYKIKEAESLYFNVYKDKLIDGVIDKNFKF